MLHNTNIENQLTTNPIHLLIFDLDGTLINSLQGIKILGFN